MNYTDQAIPGTETLGDTRRNLPPHADGDLLTVAPGRTSSRPTIGIFVKDATGRRLIEAAAVHLELEPIQIGPLHGDSLAQGRDPLRSWAQLPPDQAQIEQAQIEQAQFDQAQFDQARLDLAAVDLDALARFEIVVADQQFVPEIRALMASRDDTAESVPPALVVVIDRRAAPNSTVLQTHLPSPGKHAGYLDGELVLPLEPAALAAQLSLVLYAHRAFARRFHSALEELNLNRRIFRSVTSGISVANARLPDMPLLYVNPAFEVMTGYSLEESQGKNCRFLQRDDRDQPGLALIREAIQQKREVTAVVRNYRKDGTPFWNELSLSPIRNRSGELTHIVGIQTDVTARVEFEAALRESEKLAAVGRLASSIAHEINNPLESVMNLLYLAQNTSEHDELHRYLALADKELQRVSLIATQSLRFYKQSSKPQATRCSELLESVIDLYLGRMESARVAVSRRDRSTRSIVCMESELRQVLNNLIRNAVDAMRATGGRLLVRSRDTIHPRTGSPGVTITIVDTGSGIAPEIMKQLFTPFFTTKGIGGTGLGLWISSEIIGRHNGHLTVRSSQRPGATGTVFTLFLPAQGLA